MLQVGQWRLRRRRRRRRRNRSGARRRLAERKGCWRKERMRAIMRERDVLFSFGLIVTCLIVRDS